MAEVCVARQPIFDERLRVVAYELLFRRAATATEAAVVDAGGATGTVLWTAFAEIGMESVVGARKAFVNVPWQILRDEPVLPHPPESIVVELLEDAPATDEVVEAIRRAKGNGYTVALDDYAFAPGLEPLLEAADIVKVDMRQVDPAALPGQVARLQEFHVQMLAEKVETREELELCRSLGFKLFQGYFLERPRTLTGRTVGAGATARLSLLATLQSPETTPEELAASIARDAGLSYKLLRYMNSAFFSLPRPVGSVREAVVMLGSEAIRRWGSLLLLSTFDDAPRELLVTALVRARTCELLAATEGLDERAAGVSYTTGLFSVADALMNASLEAVLDALPLDGSVREALLRHGGAQGEVLAAIKSYERGDVDAVVPHLREHIGPLYLQALEHADGLAYALS